MPRPARSHRMVLALGITIAVAPHQSNAQAAAAIRAESTVVVLLGTGTPRPDPTASGPATAILVGARAFLFDAGAGVMRRMSAAQLPITGPTAIFVTHLHSDHTLGYPDLIFTSWVFGRRWPLESYGPHGLRAMTEHILAAWSDDIDVRTNGLEHGSPGGYAVNVHEVTPGVVYDSGGVKITAIPVPHGSWKEAFGYRIDTPNRSIVISGDTRYSPTLERAASGVDVLIHEVHPESGVAPPSANFSSDWPRYLREFHTSDVELGHLAAVAKPKMLILYHFTNKGTASDEVVATIRKQGYLGRVVVGKDLERY